MLKKSEIENIYLLSPMQEGILFDCLIKDDSVYFHQLSYEIDGVIDVEVVDKCLQLLMKRHQVLRTVLNYDNAVRPVQVVFKEKKIPISYLDCRMDDADDVENFVDDYKRKDQKQGFRLNKDSLMRVSLLKLEDRKYVLIWSWHHIILDGWSLSVLIKEFLLSYQTLAAGYECSFPDALPFNDYIKYINSVNRDEVSAFWKNYLQGYIEQTFLAEASRGLLQKTHLSDNAEFLFLFDQKAEIALNSLCKKYNAPLNAVIQTVWAVILMKILGKEDVVFGTIVSGRPAHLSGIQESVGLFSNIVPHRFRGNDKRTFGELLEACLDGALYDERYHTISLSEIQNQSDIVGGLFDHLLVFQNFPNPESLLGKETLIQSDIDEESHDVVSSSLHERINHAFAMRFNLGEELSCKITYNANLYAESFVESIKSYYSVVLDQLSLHYNEELYKIRLTTQALDAASSHELENHDISFPRNETILSIFDNVVKEKGDGVALTYRDGSMTYNRLEFLAEKLASELVVTCGLQPGEIVAFLLERSELSIIAILGIMKAGCAYLPLDPASPDERIISILKDVGAKIVVTADAFTHKLLTIGVCPIIAIDNKHYFQKDVAVRPAITVKPSDLAYIIYTSGSQGRPKGVMVEHRNVVRLFFNDGFLFHFNDKHIWLLFHSVAFDFSVWEIFGALLYGAKLVIVGKGVAQDPKLLHEQILTKSITVLNQVPPVFYLLFDEIKRCFLKFRYRYALQYVFFGGDKLDFTKLDGIADYLTDTKIVNMYGITETTVHVTHHLVRDTDIVERVSKIGTPLPTLTVRLVDKALNPVPNGLTGEMLIVGEGVARGYLNQPELTADRFPIVNEDTTSRAYLSGDLAYYHNGGLIYLGRNDRQIKVNGFRIELDEIKFAIVKYPGVDACEVLVYNERIVAFVIMKKEVHRGALRSFLRKRLVEYMLPSRIVSVKSIPLTANGKIDREKLIAGLQVGRGPGEKIPYCKHRDAVTLKLATIWQEVTGYPINDYNADFFSHGGDSIRAIRLCNQVNNSFKINFRVSNVFKHNTILAQATFIRSQLKIGHCSSRKIPKTDAIERLKQKIIKEKSPFLPVDYEDLYPATDIQKGMLIHILQDRNDTTYHDQSYMQFESADFDQAIFAKAVGLMEIKHSILRTSFDFENFDIPLQIVHRNVSPRIQFKNLAEVDFSQVKSALKAVLKKDLKKSYAVHDVGLWRIYVIKLPALEYGVLLSCHHAVLDGWSNASFFTELFNVYESLKKDENYKPSSLRASYKDFVRAQLLANEDECTLEFWKHELTDFVKTPMPFDKNAFNIYGEKNYQLLKEYRVLDENLSLRIIEFSKKNNLDLKSIFLASFVYLLKFTTGESEITLGLVASNRPEIDDGDKVLGCFLNTIPFRVSVDSYGDPRGFINSIKNKLRTMKSYDSASLIKITEVLKAHDGHSNPFFDVAFDFLDFHIFNDVNDKLNATDPIVNDYDKTNTLLDLDLTKWGNSFVVNLKTRKGLYSNDEVKRLLGYYTNILCQIVDNHTLNIREIFSKKELKTIAKITHGLVRPLGSASILEAINAYFIQLPHKVAVQQDNLFFTYQFVGKLCCNLSNYFKHSFGLAHGSRVVVMLSRSADYVNVVLSIWMADCIYIPIDPNWPEKRIMDVLNDVDPALVICESDARIALQKSVASKFRLVKFEDFDLKGSVSPEAFNVSLLTEKAAYILFTSGSTGVPKGAVVGHLGMLNHILAKTADLSINANDRIAQTATSTFDISIWQMFASLVAGASVVVYNDKLIIETSKFLQRLEKDAITILQVVPVYFSEIVVDIQESYTRPLFRSLKYLISTGEMLNREVVSQWYSLFPLVEIVNAYGPTEASDDITHFFVPKDWTNNMIPIGKPIQNTVVSILDQEGNLCPIGVKGEICAEGVGVCFGYLNRQRLSSAVFSFKEQSLYPEKPYLYCTGDIGKYNSEGLLEFYGRSDRQIKIQGNRVELQEIEEALLAFDKIKQVIVYHQLNGAQNLLIAVYTSYNGEQVENKELRRFLQSSLPQYMIPSLFQKLDTFPTTESGKVDRQAIISAYNEIFVQEQLVDDVSLGYSAESLMTIWKKMLNVETVGVDQNFFFLGGHSLKANKLAFEINHIFNVDFTLFQVFQMPTIREQAAYIDERNQLHVVNTGKYRISKSLRIGTFNLTPQQRQIWLASLSPDAKSAYLIFNTAVIAGELDVARFVDSFRLLVRRHDILRATIITRGGEPFQSIIPYEQFNLDYTFLAITDDDRRAEQIDLISVGESMKPFELSIGPLFRFKILKVSETKHIFLFTIHHIIADGWSMEILLDELGEIYKSLALEAESNWMSQPELQFEDYVSWFENTFSEAEKEKSRNYWLTLFPELPPILKLPTDYPTPSHQSFEGQIVKFTLEEKFSDLIYSMAFRENVSVYTVLISLWEIAFYKISGQVDITVGIVDAGRYSKDLDHMVGCFVKTWPLRINVDPTNNIDKLIASVSDGMVAAMENWLFPLDLLVEHLNNKLAYPHHALFNVALSFNDSFVNNDQSLLFSDLHIDELDLAQAQYSKFDLVINMWNENGKFVFEVTYRTSLFKESTIQSLSGIFKAILNSLEKDQSTALYKLKGKDLSSFFSAERHSINQKFDFDIK